MLALCVALIAGTVETLSVPTVEVEPPPETPKTSNSDTLSVKSGEGRMADDDAAKSTMG